MRVFGGEITQEQIEAGLVAMNKRTFGVVEVSAALKKAGAISSHDAGMRLINRELRLGNIRRVATGIYEKSSHRGPG